MKVWLSSLTSRTFLKGIGIGLLLGISLLWILSLTGYLPASWSTPLGAMFVIFATFIAYLQWIFPLSIHSEDQAYQILLRQFKSLPTMYNGTVVIRTSAEEGRQIYATKCPSSEILEMLRMGSKERSIVTHIASAYDYITMSAGNYTVNGKLVQVALFPNLSPGEYIFWTPRVSERRTMQNYFSYSVVSAGIVTEVDWRYGSTEWIENLKKANIKPPKQT